MVSIQNCKHSDKPSQWTCQRCGRLVPQLWQDEPPDYVPGGWRQNRKWTESLAGHDCQAKKLARCMKRNARKYRFEVTINFEVILCPKCHRATWSKIVRRLRDVGVEALWIREISKSNLVHVHFTVSNLSDVKECRRLFEMALPTRDDVPSRLHVDDIKSRAGWIDYFCKYGKKWRDKRVLFQRKTGVQKYGVVGKFWARKPDDIWAEHVATVKMVHDGLKLHGMAAVLRDAVALVGDYVSLKAIRWNLVFFANSDTVAAWREEKIANPTPFEEQPPRRTATSISYRQSQHKSLQNSPSSPPFSTFQAGETVSCDWLPGIPAQLAPCVQTYQVIGGEVRSYPPEGGWSLHFPTPSDSVLEGIPIPIRERIVSTAEGMQLSGVTEDDLRKPAKHQGSPNGGRSPWRLTERQHQHGDRQGLKKFNDRKGR